MSHSPGVHVFQRKPEFVQAWRQSDGDWQVKYPEATAWAVVPDKIFRDYYERDFKR